MEMDCYHRGGRMHIAIRLTSDDIGQLDTLFPVVRKLLEIDAEHAPPLNRHRLMLGNDLSDTVMT